MESVIYASKLLILSRIRRFSTKKKLSKNGIFGKPIALFFSRKMDPPEALIFLVKKGCNKRKA